MNEQRKSEKKEDNLTKGKKRAKELIGLSLTKKLKMSNIVKMK